MPLRGRKVPYGGQDVNSVLFGFLRSKLSPAAGTAVDLAEGKDVAGNPVTPGGEALRLVTPMPFGDIYDAMRSENVPAALALGLIAMLGAHVSIRDQRPRGQ